MAIHVVNVVTLFSLNLQNNKREENGRKGKNEEEKKRKKKTWRVTTFTTWSMPFPSTRATFDHVVSM
jgi:hypothetical protein